MKHAVALAAATLSETCILYTVYKTVDADGSWYNNLYREKGRDNVTFIDKLKETVHGDDRNLSFVRTGAALTLIPVTVYVLTRVMISGVLNF